MAAHLPQLFSGARGKIIVTKADGTDMTLGVATDISVDIRNDIRPTMVVGSLNPVALDPMGVDVSASIGRIIPVTANPTTPTAATLNPQPKVNEVTAIDYGFEAAINDILETDGLTITIQDQTTGQVLACIRGARFTGKSMSLSTGDIGNERYQFVGIYDSANGNSVNRVGEAVSNIGYGSGVDST